MCVFGLSGRVVATFLGVVCIICHFSSSVANAVVIQLPRNERTLPAGKQNSTKEVTVHVKGRPLQEVARAIQENSGIRFDVAESLVEKPVTVSFTGTDWDTVIRKVLRPFNWIGILNKDGKLDHIFVLQSGEELAMPPTIVTNPAPPLAPQEEGVDGPPPAPLIPPPPAWP